MPQVSFTVSHSLAELGKMVEWRGRLGKRCKHRPLTTADSAPPACCCRARHPDAIGHRRGNFKPGINAGKLSAAPGSQLN